MYKGIKKKVWLLHWFHCVKMLTLFKTYPVTDTNSKLLESFSLIHL